MITRRFILLEHRHRPSDFERFQTEQCVASGVSVPPTLPRRLAVESLNIDSFITCLLSQTVCSSVHLITARAMALLSMSFYMDEEHLENIGSVLERILRLPDREVELPFISIIFAI